MNNLVKQPLRQSAGDTAVDGLIAGLGAGVLMTIYLLLSSLIGGESPLLLIARFDASGQSSPVTGVLTHLAVSGIYGIVFALGVRYVPLAHHLPQWLVGSVYGLLLLLTAYVLILPRANSALREIPLMHFAIAHWLYGVTLGFITARYLDKTSRVG